MLTAGFFVKSIVASSRERTKAAFTVTSSASIDVLLRERFVMFELPATTEFPVLARSIPPVIVRP